MNKELKRILKEETIAFKNLLKVLEEQHSYIALNKIMDLASVVEKVDKCNKEIAVWEMERRKAAKGREMKEIISSYGDLELEESYKNINKLLNEIMTQKETNEMLIKQRVAFSTEMLNIIKPDRAAKTYNSFGKRR